MKPGSKVLFYHSTSKKTLSDKRKSCVNRFKIQLMKSESGIEVEIKPSTRFENSMTLDEIKREKFLKNVA